MRNRRQLGWAVLTAAALIAALSNVAAAAPQAEIAAVGAGGDAVVWQPLIGGYERLVLTVSGPDGVVRRQEFAAGEAPSFSLFDAAGFHLPDGSYTWELQVVRTATRTRTGDETDAGLSSASYGLRPAGGGSEATVQSGSFAVVGGDAVVAGLAEPVRDAASVAAPSKAIVAPDFVIADDEIVQGSLCVGFDCVNGETFGFDTIRMKENNLRIAAVDTSSLSGFPTQDWQLTFNDSASGGQNKFSIDAISPTANTPFTIIAGAPSNSLFVNSSGRVGLRTATPVLDLHISTGNTPGIRLEQNSSGGFAAQSWDIAGNETNFFVRDVTGGSLLPFRIRPGAPSSSIDISGTGNVGIGTSSPDAKLDVEGSGDTEFLVTRTGGTGTTFKLTTTDNNAFFGTSTNDVMAFTVNAVERMRINTSGNVGIGCQSPGSKLVVGSVASCATAPASSMNPGDTTFTAASSRTYKENLAPVRVNDILDKILGIGVYQYDFINGPKDKIGLMAEDFHQIFGHGSDKLINGQEMTMALWLAVQELTTHSRELEVRNDDLVSLQQQLKAENEELATRLSRLEAMLTSPH